MNYLLHLLIMMNIYLPLILGMNLLAGYSNMISMCQGAFYGIGAYITAIVIVKMNLGFMPAISLVCLGAILFSLVISLPSLKLHGDYFVLATLAFMMVTFSIMYNWIPVTNGPYGISGIPRPTLLGIVKIDTIGAFALLSSMVSVLMVIVFRALVHSPFGRVLQAIRDDETLVESSGRNIFHFKVFAFAISAVMSAIAGFMFATYMTYIDPSSFTLDESIFILSAAIIGGTGNIIGSIVAVLFIISIPELIRLIQFPDAIAPNIRQIIYGLILILLMYFRPKGLLGKHEFGK